MFGAYFTAVVFAKNESKRLPFVLQNLSRLPHVIVIDNFSSDDTAKIAAEFGRKVVQIFNNGGFVETPEVLDQVWPHVSTEYFLICACAELLPPALLACYDQVSKAKSYDVVRVSRISITAGLPIPIDLPPRWLRFRYAGEVRFFRKGAVDYTDNRVHERGRVTVASNRVLRFDGDDTRCMVQFRDYDSIETEKRHAIYNDQLARQLVAQGRSMSFTKGFIVGLKVFLVRYFIYGGFRYGKIGFMHCYYRFQMFVSIAFRCHEIKIKLDSRGVCERNFAAKRMFLDIYGGDNS